MVSVVFVFVALSILIIILCVLMRNKCRENVVENREAIGHLVLTIPENAVTVDVVVEN
jgi:hypothetical protein